MAARRVTQTLVGPAHVSEETRSARPWCMRDSKRSSPPMWANGGAAWVDYPSRMVKVSLVPIQEPSLGRPRATRVGVVADAGTTIIRRL